MTSILLAAAFSMRCIFVQICRFGKCTNHFHEFGDSKQALIPPNDKSSSKICHWRWGEQGKKAIYHFQCSSFFIIKKILLVQMHPRLFWRNTFCIIPECFRLLDIDCSCRGGSQLGGLSWCGAERGSPRSWTLLSSLVPSSSFLAS